MNCYQCAYCENFQEAQDPRQRGLCERKGEEKGPRTRACEDFRLMWEIKRRVLENMKGA